MISNIQTRCGVAKSQNNRLGFLDLSRAELTSLQTAFESREIQTFKDLLPKLMQLCPSMLPEDFLKAFGSYISHEGERITWDKMLYILEEEMNLDEKRQYESRYGKKVYLSRVRQIDLCQPPTEFFYDKYSLSFCRKIRVACSEKPMFLMVVNKSFIALLNEGMTQVIDTKYFSRDYIRHFKNKFYISLKQETSMQKASRLPNRNIAHLFTLDDTREVLKDSILRVENQDNWFDVMKYSGLKVTRKHGINRTKSRLSRSRAQSAGQKTEDTSLSGWDNSRISEDDINIPKVQVGAIRFFNFGTSKSMKPNNQISQRKSSLGKNAGYIKLDELELEGKNIPANSKVSFVEDTSSQQLRVEKSTQVIPEPVLPVKKSIMSEIFGQRRRLIQSGKSVESSSNKKEDSALNRGMNSVNPSGKFNKDLKLSTRELRSGNATRQQKQKFSITDGLSNIKSSYGMTSTRLTLAESRARTAGIREKDDTTFKNGGKSGFQSTPTIAQETLIEDNQESPPKEDGKSIAPTESIKGQSNRKSLALIEERRSSIHTNTKRSATREIFLRKRLGSVNSQHSGGKSRSVHPQTRMFDELKNSFGVNDFSIITGNISVVSKIEIEKSDTLIDQLDVIDIDKQDEIIDLDLRKNRRDQFQLHAENSLRLGLDITNHSDAINEVIKSGNAEKARMRGIEIPKQEQNGGKVRKKAWNRQSLMLLTQKAHPFESKPINDANKEDLNSKEKPRSGAHIIDSSSTTYWEKINVLVVGFLNREILTYAIENDRGRVDIAIKRLEEIELEEVCTDMHISPSIYSEKEHFFMMTFNFTKVRIYHIPLSVTNCDFLSSTMTKRNQVFEELFTGLPKIHYCLGGFSVNSHRTNIRLYQQCSFSEFTPSLSLQLYQKFTPTTITSIDFSKKHNLLVAGCASGDLFVYDGDLRGVVFKHKGETEKVVAVKVFDVLGQIVVVYERAGLRSFDIASGSFREIERIEGLGKSGDVDWVVMPDLDLERLPKDSRLTEEEEDRRQLKFAESRVRNGHYSIFMGRGVIWEYKFIIKADKEFAQVAMTLKQMGSRTELDTKKEDLSSKILSDQARWLFVCQNSAEDMVLMISETNLAVYYDYINKLIIKYEMLEIGGEIASVEIVNDNTQFVVAEKSGEIKIYNLQQIIKVRTYYLNCGKLFQAAGVFNGIFDLTCFILPNEVFIIKTQSIQKPTYTFERSNAKDLLAFSLQSGVLQVYTDLEYIFVLLDTLMLVVISKKSMKLAKEFNLTFDIERSFVESVSLYGRTSQQYLHTGIMKNRTLYLLFESGNLLVGKFSHGSVSDISVYVTKLGTVGLLTVGLVPSQFYFWPKQNMGILVEYAFDYSTGKVMSSIPIKHELERELKQSLKKFPELVNRKDVQAFKKVQEHAVQLGGMNNISSIFITTKHQSLIIVNLRAKVNVCRMKPFILHSADIYKMIKENQTLENKRANTTFLQAKKRGVLRNAITKQDTKESLTSAKTPEAWQSKPAVGKEIKAKQPAQTATDPISILKPSPPQVQGTQKPSPVQRLQFSPRSSNSSSSSSNAQLDPPKPKQQQVAQARKIDELARPAAGARAVKKLTLQSSPRGSNSSSPSSSSSSPIKKLSSISSPPKRQAEPRRVQPARRPQHGIAPV